MVVYKCLPDRTYDIDFLRSVTIYEPGELYRNIRQQVIFNLYINF